MLNINLKNIAYTFYPKGVDAISERENYIKSTEYHNLQKTIKLYEEYSKSTDFKTFKKELSEISENRKFIDKTLFEWQDRCYSFHFYETNNNKQNFICLYISIIAPVYTTYILEVDINPETSRWLDLPKKSTHMKENFHNELESIRNFTELKTGYLFITDKIATEVIDDINFQDVPLGKFTLFNTFFLNNKL